MANPLCRQEAPCPHFFFFFFGGGGGGGLLLRMPFMELKKEAAISIDTEDCWRAANW